MFMKNSVNSSLATDRLSAISRVVIRRCTYTSMTKITTPSENCSMWHTLSPIHILHSTVNVGSTNTFCLQKLDYCALSLFGGIHGTIINCYLASVSVSNTLPLSSVYQISPDIHCHLPKKSQSSTARNNGAPNSVPLSLWHALYMVLFTTTTCFGLLHQTSFRRPDDVRCSQLKHVVGVKKNKHIRSKWLCLFVNKAL
jgi:hypothetical protein